MSREIGLGGKVFTLLDPLPNPPPTGSLWEGTSGKDFHCSTPHPALSLKG